MFAVKALVDVTTAASFRSSIAFITFTGVIVSSTFAFVGFVVGFRFITLIAAFVTFASGTTKPSIAFSFVVGVVGGTGMTTTATEELGITATVVAE